MGRSSSLSVRFRSVPSSQVKTFRSSRLKRLQTSPTKPDENNDEDDEPERSVVPFSSQRTLSMRFSLSSSSPSLLNRFRSLSTCHFHPSRRPYYLSNPRRTITLFRTNSSLPAVAEEESHSDTTTTSSATTTTTPDPSQLSCTIVDTRRPTGNACNVEELAAYLDNFLYLPKSLSGAAELMYT